MLIAAIVLLVLGLLMFKVAVGFAWLLLLLFVVALVAYFVRRPRRRAVVVSEPEDPLL